MCQKEGDLFTHEGQLFLADIHVFYLFIYFEKNYLSDISAVAHHDEQAFGRGVLKDKSYDLKSFWGFTSAAERRLLYSQAFGSFKTS